MIDPLTTCDEPGSIAVIAGPFTPSGAICNNATDDDLDGFTDCADIGGLPGENCSTDQSCQPFAYYYLVTARSPCDPAADRESNYGQNSFGVDRPTAAPSIGCPTCTTCPL